MTEIYSGCFEKLFEVWTTPPKGQHWTNNLNMTEQRCIRTCTTKSEADMVIEILKWAGCECEIKEIFKPIKEIPIINVDDLETNK